VFDFLFRDKEVCSGQSSIAEKLKLKTRNEN